MDQSYAIGGLLPGAQVDLVNWLDEPVINQEYQGFCEGAKETYLPSPAVNRARNWSPVYSDVSDDLLDSDLASDNLDDCLSLNLKDDNFHMQLSGEDAEWARGVAEDYRQLQQKRTGRRRRQAQCSGQQHFDDGYSSNGPIDSPPYQYYRRDVVNSPSSPASDLTSSPMSETYNSPEYCNFYTPEQSVNQNNNWDLEELYQEDINTVIKSERGLTSPHGQSEINFVNTSILQPRLSNYNNEESNQSYIIAYDNDSKASIAEETTIEIGHNYEVEKQAPFIHSRNNEFGYCQQSTPKNEWYGSSAANTPHDGYQSPDSQQPSLKDLITHEGDSILRDLISPIQRADGSEITARFVGASSEYVDDPHSIDDPLNEESSSEASFYSEKKAKRVPFTAEERRLRKKDQNKRAAVKYREKKKIEMDEITERYQAGLKLNTELEEMKRKKMAEFDMIRSLLLEKLRNKS